MLYTVDCSQADSLCIAVIVLLIHRVVTRGTKQEIAGHSFTGFGAHHSDYPCTYLTAAAALGITKSDVDSFIRRLDKVFSKKITTTTEQTLDAAPTLTVNDSKEACLVVGADSDSQDRGQLDDASSQNDTTADTDVTAASAPSF